MLVQWSECSGQLRQHLQLKLLGPCFQHPRLISEAIPHRMFCLESAYLSSEVCSAALGHLEDDRRFGIASSLEGSYNCGGRGSVLDRIRHMVTCVLGHRLDLRWLGSQSSSSEHTRRERAHRLQR